MVRKEMLLLQLRNHMRHFLSKAWECFVCVLTWIVRVADGLGKLGGAALLLLAVLWAIPFTEVKLKLLTSDWYGVSGSVYYEVGKNGDGMVSIWRDEKEVVDGGLFLLRAGNRQFDNLQRGDVLQAGTEKKFRLPLSPEEVIQFAQAKAQAKLNEQPIPIEKTLSVRPIIFVLQPGECVIVQETFPGASVEPSHGGSAGWLNVATTNCGLFE